MSEQVDLSEFFKLARPKKPPCQVGFFGGQLKPGEKAQLDAALGTDKGIINAGAIREWFHIRGHEVTIMAVVNHRQGTCTCHDERS
jgi:hypothetical protein